MNNVFLRLAHAAAFGCLFTPVQPVLAQGTAFTFQGRLQNNGGWANGNYDFTFALFNHNSTNPPQLGVTLTDTNVGVTNGLFTVTLDFGSVFAGNATWLSIAVRTNGGTAFTGLNPLQRLTPAPYAIYAPNAGTAASANSVASSNIVGSLATGQLPAGVALLSGGNAFAGNQTFASGNVGIGYGASPAPVYPQEALYINSSDPIGAIIGMNGTTSGGHYYEIVSAGTGAATTAGSLGIFDYTAGTYRLSINGSGNVGIGTTMPDTALQVNGTVTATAFNGNGAGLTNVTLGSLNSIGDISWGNFVFLSSPGAGSHPQCVCAADVNGDGKADLICANLAGNALTVLTNNGSGGFAISSSSGAGGPANSVCAADVNGDGKVDFICANTTANTLTVLTNNGSGGFAISSSPGVGAGPVSVCAADVNGDGKVDLICANEDGNTLTVLTNNGSGGFVTSGTYGVGTAPICVCAADVNGDGTMDLICANLGDSTLTVLINNGGGGFAISSSPGVGGGPLSVCAADVNGDGKVDLICANRDGNSLTVLTNNGSGGFAISSSPGVGSFPDSVCAADVNGDGKVDLICANGLDNTLIVLTNNGSGGFAISSSSSTGNFPVSVCAADVNGDGKVDLICANLNDNALTVLLNTAVFNGAFNGNGAGLTGLAAANLTGALPAISGASLTGLNASQLTSGTIPLAQLPSTVAFLNSNQSFAGQNSFSGNVGLGTNSPSTEKLVVAGGIDLASHAASPTTDDGLGLSYESYGGRIQSFQSRPLILNPIGNNVGIGVTNPSFRLQVNGSVAGVGAYNNVSDARFKTNITRLTHALDKIMALQGVEYDWRSNAYPQMKFDQGKQLGFVAQEIKEVLPEVVSQDDLGYYSIAYSKVIPVLVEAIKDQQKEMEKENKESNADVEILRQENVSLQKRLKALEQAVHALTEKK